MTNNHYHNFNFCALELSFIFSQNHFQKEATKEVSLKKAGFSNLTDAELWTAFQAGSEKAFSVIYRKNASLLYSYGLKLVKDKELIKDCIQDLFVEIWNTKHKLSPVKSIKSYLFKSIRRKLISESVKKRKSYSKNKEIIYFKTTATELEESDLIPGHLEDQNQLRLKCAINHLTSRQKEVIYLKYFSKLTYTEIAETMELSMKGTYKLMGRSMEFLRKYMQKDSKIETA